jgi:hypothetical protein
MKSQIDNFLLNKTSLDQLIQDNSNITNKIEQLELNDYSAVLTVYLNLLSNFVI